MRTWPAELTASPTIDIIATFAGDIVVHVGHIERSSSPRLVQTRHSITRLKRSLLWPGPLPASRPLLGLSNRLTTAIVVALTSVAPLQKRSVASMR